MKKITLSLLSIFCILSLIQCNTASSNKTKTGDSTAVNSDSMNVTNNWKIGVQMWTFKMFTFAEALDKVDSAGVKYIEAYWGQPLGAGMKDSFGIKMSDESRSKPKQLLLSKGIHIVAMGVI